MSILLNKITISIFSLSAVFFIASSVQAQSAADISYPIAELGNCKDEVSCRAYCELPEHMEPCLDFAEEHNLIPQQEIQRMRQIGTMEIEGPGGCTSQQECELYCEDIDHIDECLDYAEDNDMIPPEELEEARKVSAALKAGFRPPGGCRRKDECDVYCSIPDHMLECMDFGERAGLIPPSELEEVQKMKTALRAGVKPPPCGRKEQCDIYCSQPEHMEECMDFALKAGFIPPEEQEQVEKTMRAIKAGVKPPPCRGREECDTYCSQPENMGQCLDFAEAAGFMSKEEAEMARKMGGRGGPGGCKSKQECEAFCNNPENQETCFQFAKENGLIPPEDLERMKEGVGQMRMGLEQAPPEVRECLKGKVSEEVLSKVESGEKMPNPELGNQMRDCFESFKPQMMEKMKEGFRQAPPQVKQCLETLVGAEVLSRVEAGEPPTPELGDRMRTCFEQFKPAGEGQMPGEEGFAPGTGPSQPGDFFGNMPSEVSECIQSSVGSEVAERLKSGQPPEGDVGYKIQKCFQGKMSPPSGPREGMQGPEGMPSEGMMPPEGGMPPEGIRTMGPGGCSSAEECSAYCAEHPEECGAGGMAPPQEFQEGIQFGPPEQMMPREGEQMFGPMMPGGPEIMPPQPNEMQIMPSQEQMAPPQENQMIVPQEQMMVPMSPTEPGSSPPPSEPAPAPESPPSSFRANSLFGAIIQYFFGVQ